MSRNEDQLKALEEERRHIGTELSLIVEELGGKVTWEFFGRLKVSNASFFSAMTARRLKQ